MTFETVYFSCTHCLGRFVLFPDEPVSDVMYDREVAKHVAATHPDVDRPLTKVVGKETSDGFYYNPRVAQ